MSRDLSSSMESSWLNKVLHRLGFLLTGWLQSLLQTLVTFILLVVIFCVLLVCVKKMVIWSVTQQSQHVTIHY